MFVVVCKQGEPITLIEEGRPPITIVNMQKNSNASISIGIKASQTVEIIRANKLSLPRIKHKDKCRSHCKDV